ncbi:MAG: murein transglycosylase A, partial [Pseudomonadota bacterium]
MASSVDGGGAGPASFSGDRIVFACVLGALALGIFFFLLIIWRTDRAPSGPAPERASVSLRTQSVALERVRGWKRHDPYPALAPFTRSCARLQTRAPDAPANPLEALGPDASPQSFSGRVADWAPACAKATALLEALEGAPASARAERARAFFETAFAAYRVGAVETGEDGSSVSFDGRFTGYFEPFYEARRERDGDFAAPVYARPDDLVMVDLGRFREELAGVRIAGRVEDGRLAPYADHRAINDGALADRAAVLAYMRPTDLFFMQIQGSAQLQFDDGERVRVGYAGQNGHPYTPVGRILIEDGAVAREDMSMQAIRDWLAGADPDDAQALREANASYVFFRHLDDALDPGLGPLGAQGVQLATMRSLAVDRRFHAMGAPIFLTAAVGEPGLADGLAHLFVAQDTGGAIRGPARADIFTGAGGAAGDAAGGLNARGAMIALVPHAVAELTNTHTHTQTHTHTHTYIHTYIHTHNHTNSNSLNISDCISYFCSYYLTHTQTHTHTHT